MPIALPFRLKVKQDIWYGFYPRFTETSKIPAHVEFRRSDILLSFDIIEDLSLINQPTNEFSSAVKAAAGLKRPESDACRTIVL